MPGSDAATVFLPSVTVEVGITKNCWSPWLVEIVRVLVATSNLASDGRTRYRMMEPFGAEQKD
jgi:hypothetical protein